MKALTIWQPWASLIIAGAKPFEFRRWAAPRRVVGQRIVIHAGARTVALPELEGLLGDLRAGRASVLGGGSIDTALGLLEPASRDRSLLPLAAGLGTAVLGEPRRAIDLCATLQTDPDDIDPEVWAWPMLDIQPFPAPRPAKGAQQFWTWPAAEPVPVAAAGGEPERPRAVHGADGSALVIHTIGHSNHPIERFLALLRGAGITAVADVRSKPYSRFYPQYRQQALREALAGAGIAYVFLGAELGGLVRAAPAVFDQGIERLLAGARQYRIAILCAEKDPADCHRGLLIAPALVARGAVVRHILADGTMRDGGSAAP